MATVMFAPQNRHRDNNAFRSVFPSTHFTTPTPEATPNIGALSSPVQAFGGFNVSNSISDNTIEFNRAWSIATRFLTLPPGIEGKAKTLDNDVLKAFALLLESASTQKDLVSWYTNEISVHFRNYVRPLLGSWDQPIPLSNATAILQSTVELLQKSQNRYLANIEALTSNLRHSSLSNASNNFAAQIKQNLHTNILHSLPRQRLQKTLASVMFQQMHSSLQQSSNHEKCLKDVECHCQLDLRGLPLKDLFDIGFGGLLAERAFAHAVHKFLRGPGIERRCFQVDWSGRSSVVKKLRGWVERNLAPVLEQALATLTGNALLKLTQNDVQQFVAMAVSNLGRLRVLSLFDYVKSWPDSTGALLDIREYLNAGNQSDKAHVCQSFSSQVQRRLLHAGASTSEILSIYVNIIHTFKSLDSRGVLLEKVAVPVRNYLRAREDTVGIIAASFLADVDRENQVTANDMDKICPDISIEVVNSTLEEKRDNKMLNWDDMNWMPDPIDAGPDYKSSKSEDVIAYILALFEQEEFIKEVTTVLAQHLLHSTDAEYVKETRLVELFKSRLDPSKLQAAEVMLKDVRDSVSLGKRINPHATYDTTNTAAAAAAPTPKEIQAAIPEDGITHSSLWKVFEGRIRHQQFLGAVRLVANKRDGLFYPKRTRMPPEPQGSSSSKKKQSEMEFKAQILSSFFWPPLRSNDFDMPAALKAYPSEFEERFDRLGSQRKLQFRPALARISLRLELEDRVVEESDVAGWRASVIDSFTTEQQQQQRQSLAAGHEEPVTLTAENLMQALNMEEELVQDALNFWSLKSVLYQPSPGMYAVLERLDIDPSSHTQAHQHQQQQQQQQEEEISAVKSQNAMLRDSAPVFETFIANMLRNQGAKAIGGVMGITALLRMFLPAFTYGDEEVGWLLAEMEGRGEVVRNGDVWSVVQ